MRPLLGIVILVAVGYGCGRLGLQPPIEMEGAGGGAGTVGSAGRSGSGGSPGTAGTAPTGAMFDLTRVP